MPWKTTCQKEQRWKFIQEFLRHKTHSSSFRGDWAISRKTAYKWIGRFKERGRFGLADRLHVARRIHNRPCAKWLGRIRRWRLRHPHWGAPKLHWALKRRFGAKGLPSESAIEPVAQGVGTDAQTPAPCAQGTGGGTAQADPSPQAQRRLDRGFQGLVPHRAMEPGWNH
jgi:putative transposase